jgi:hypothetical protein
MGKQPAAFMSYVRFNDLHDDGLLSEFRQRLSAEVRMQTGEEFLIFQDRSDIAWGQNWQRRIDQTLDAVTLLIAIVSPSFFRSSACRNEVTRFLERERELGRDDLILPVYYVETPEIEEPDRRKADKLARTLAERQFADWRELRFEPFTSPVVRQVPVKVSLCPVDVVWYGTGTASGPRVSLVGGVWPAAGRGRPVRRQTPPARRPRPRPAAWRPGPGSRRPRAVAGREGSGAAGVIG